MTALLLGPVLESGTHGYDTADLFRVDRRLGSNDDLKALIAACHENGLKVMLDAVFHHVGRDFWAFRDVQERGAASPYRDWFFLDFSATSPAGDPFSYEGWNGHFDLVKLNTAHPAVREHLFSAARLWLSDFGADGLRLDAADTLDRGFQRDLAGVCREVKPVAGFLARSSTGIIGSGPVLTNSTPRLITRSTKGFTRATTTATISSWPTP